MFGESQAIGFIPMPAIDLRAGNLYGLVVSLLIFGSCLYSAWSIIIRSGQIPAGKIFSYFLLALGFYWLLEAVTSLLVWINLPYFFMLYPLRLTEIFPLLILFYFFAAEIFPGQIGRRSLCALYCLAGIAYLGYCFSTMPGAAKIVYWGIEWNFNPLALQLFYLGLLLPPAMLAVFLLGKKSARGEDATICLAAIIFILLEFIKISAATNWMGLLVRLCYVLIAFGALIYYVGNRQGVRMIARDEKVVSPQLRRWPFFTRLLFLFLLLSVVPITITSFLMFSTFKEIIDLYVQKPLLFNMKSSREAFLAALANVQIQALVLTVICALLVVVAAVLISRGIARSLQRISAGLEKVSRGDFSFKLVPDSNDEIGDVVNYFNNMSEEIRHAREVMENVNHWLENKVKERTEELRILFDVSKAIGSTLDFDLLLSRSIDLLAPVMKLDVYAVLIPGENNQFSIRICKGCDQLLGGPLIINEGQGFFGRALSENGAVYSNQPEHESDELINRLGAQAVMAVALRAKGKMMGVLMIGTRQPHRYTEEREVNLLTSIAEQLAIALENIGIYEKEKEAVARLTEVDRIKNEFISMVSHELRTPVTSADGYVSLFLAGVTGPLTDDQKKYLAIVKENNQRLLALINRLLDFSKIETGRFSIKRELISINEVIRAAVDSMQSMFDKKQAQLVFKLEAANANFMGDREKMQEAVVNLLENALKFSREEPLTVEVTTRDRGDAIEVVIADNGVGIEPEHLERIFNKFYQIEDTMTRKVGGVGLGLALVKEIIGYHHGKVWAESDGKGKGAKFVFELPLAEKV